LPARFEQHVEVALVGGEARQRVGCLGDVDRFIGADRQRLAQREGRDVGGDDLRRTGAARGDDEQGADRPAAVTSTRLPSTGRRAAPHAVRRERLDHRPFLVAHAGGEAVRL